MTEFGFRILKDGRVRISWQGRAVVTLAGDRAAAFREQAATATPEQLELLLARVTGNFKRSNERLARQRSRRA